MKENLLKISFPLFKNQEKSILLCILQKYKNNDDFIELSYAELKHFLGSGDTEELYYFAHSLMRKFFKSNYSILRQDGEKLKQETINVFTHVELVYLEKNNKFISFKIKLNPIFLKSFNELTTSLSDLELSDLVSFNSKYAKILYRLLRPHVRKGSVYIEWEDFVKIMEIPPSYVRQSDINSEILHPAIKELSKEHYFFDRVYTPFANLDYEKEKTKTKGNKVIGITFTFKPIK